VLEQYQLCKFDEVVVVAVGVELEDAVEGSVLDYLNRYT